MAFTVTLDCTYSGHIYSTVSHIRIQRPILSDCVMELGIYRRRRFSVDSCCAMDLHFDARTDMKSYAQYLMEK